MFNPASCSKHSLEISHTTEFRAVSDQCVFIQGEIGISAGLVQCTSCDAAVLVAAGGNIMMQK